MYLDLFFPLAWDNICWIHFHEELQQYLGLTLMMAWNGMSEWLIMVQHHISNISAIFWPEHLYTGRQARYSICFTQSMGNPNSIWASHSSLLQTAFVGYIFMRNSECISLFQQYVPCDIKAVHVFLIYQWLPDAVYGPHFHLIPGGVHAPNFIQTEQFDNLPREFYTSTTYSRNTRTTEEC